MREADLKRVVRTKLEKEHADDCSTRIVEEMGIWSSTVRIDVAVINGELTGFELKSARDNLNRLPSQESMYSRVFDRMTIVTAENHLSGCLERMPEWWGVTIASLKGSEDGEIRLEQYRTGSFNPAIDAVCLSRLLWKQEARDCLERYNLAIGYRSKSVGIMQERLANELSLDVLRNEVRSAIKQRNKPSR